MSVILALGLLASAVQGRNLAIRDVAIERCADCDFRRLVNYFSERNYRFRHGLCRTDPDRWEGLYAVLFLNDFVKNLPSDCTVSFEFLLAADPQWHRLTIPLEDMRRRSRELWLGLTDERWDQLLPDDLLAWRVRILSGSVVLCQRQSFLFPDGEGNGLAAELPRKQEEVEEDCGDYGMLKPAGGRPTAK
ncbi:MAG: hypothetical protein LBH53_03680 [Puniceicoccales bacterium]|jgi:hypothetical protein|nr:hypothetical protein [Puniceicoccales bacterium]